VVIRDFLRRCKGRDDPLAELATMTPFKLLEWYTIMINHCSISHVCVMLLPLTESNERTL
jgi:hypothetical protein